LCGASSCNRKDEISNILAVKTRRSSQVQLGFAPICAARGQARYRPFATLSLTNSPANGFAMRGKKAGVKTV
jgi:hypothetical protein